MSDSNYKPTEKVSGLYPDRDIKAEREALPDTIYLYPDNYMGEDCWPWCPDPAHSYEQDPADAVAYIRADSLPKPSTEVPTVPGLYVIDWVDSNGQARQGSLDLFLWGSDEFGFDKRYSFRLPIIIREVIDPNLLPDLFSENGIHNPTFTLIREAT